MAKIVFVQNSFFDIGGPMAISAYLKSHGHQVDLLIEKAEGNFLTTLKKLNPDLVAFSFVSMQREWVLQCSEKIKKNLNVKIVCGGIDPTFFPDIINYPSIDMVCIGEGEESILELMNSLDESKDITKDINNFWIKKNNEIYKNDVRPLIEDLDLLPIPDRSIYYDRYKFIRNYPVKRFVVGRGCPYSCIFCCNKELKNIYKGKGKYVRRQSVEKTIEEVKYIVNNYKTRMIDFSDDEFIFDLKWLTEFSERYKKEIGIPFTCLVRINLVTEDIARLLKESGCTTVQFGIETGNEELRNKVLKKKLKNEDIIRGAAILKKFGFKINTYNMFNIPGETIENGFETVELNQRIGTDYPWSSIIQPFPGTEILKIVSSKKDVNDNNIAKHLDFYSTSIIKQRDSSKLINLEKFFYISVRFKSLNFIIKKLIFLPPNFIFKIIFILTFGYRHLRLNKLRLWETIKFNFRHLKNYF